MGSLFDDIAAEFPPATVEAWRTSVDEALKGRSFDAALVARTPEGLLRQPLYTRRELPSNLASAPGAMPWTRGLPAGPGEPLRRGWVRTARVEHPDAAIANAILLDDLQGGIERAVVHVVPAARARAAHAGGTCDLDSRRGGAWVGHDDDLATLLAHVKWSLAPVALRAGADATLASRLFTWCADRRGAGSGLGTQIDIVRCALAGADGETGGLRTRLAALRGHVAADVRRAEDRDPTTPAGRLDARPLLITTAALRLAGADVVQEMAAALGAFVALARELETMGVARSAAVRATEFELVAGSDQFTEIAKFRAFRQCLAQVLNVLGVADRAGDLLVSAVTAEDTLATRDVHVNLLRTSTQASAAVFGGVDSLTVLPFDLRVTGGSALGRRLARNIHALLAEESAAGDVSDPAGGAFYIERRTADLAEAAWQAFTTWEREGGFVTLSGSGGLRAAIDARWQAADARLRSGQDPVLGVSAFPPGEERGLEPDPFDAAAFAARWSTRLQPAAGEAARPAWPRRYREDAARAASRKP